MAPEIYYGTTWMVDSRKYPDSMTELTEITDVPGQFNRTELPLKLSHNGRILTFSLLGKDHIDSFLEDFELRTSEYEDLVGRVVNVFGRRETIEVPALVQPLYGIKPRLQVHLVGLRRTAQINDHAPHP